MVLVLLNPLGRKCISVLSNCINDGSKKALLANYSYDFNLVGHCAQLAHHGHFLGYTRSIHLSQPWLDWARPLYEMAYGYPAPSAIPPNNFEHHAHRYGARRERLAHDDPNGLPLHVLQWPW